MTTDPDFEWVAAHEAGHLIGLDDMYRDVTQSGQTFSQAFVGWEKNMMAAVNGTVDKRNVEALVEKNVSLLDRLFNWVTAKMPDSSADAKRGKTLAEGIAPFIK